MYYIQCNTTKPEKKDKIILYATTWMDLEGMMINEISQTKTLALFHSYVEDKHTQGYREQISGYQRGRGLGVE